ncbi:MAG TPA: hypothetical protein VIG69_11355 [Candidatus Methylomirabilis sp.]|jgi:hypothetical protein
MTSSSRAKHPTTAWRADSRLGLALAGAALLSLLWLPAAAFAAEEAGGSCVRVVRQEAVLEGGGLRVRGDVTNGCPYVVREVRVQVEARDKDGQVLGTGEGFVDPAVVGAQQGARFDVPLAVTVEPAKVIATPSWRR